MRIFLCILAFGLIALSELSVRSLGWPIASIVVFAIYLREILLRFPIPTEIFAATAIIKLLFLFSLVCIAFQVPMPELGNIVAKGAVYSGYYALISAVSLWLAAFTFEIARRITPARATPEWPLASTAIFLFVVAIAAVEIGVLLWTGVRNGFPLLQGDDRFLFRANQDFAFELAISFKPVIAGLIGFVVFRTARLARRILMTALFLMLLGLAALFGDKFFSLIIMVLYFLIPYFVLSGGVRFRLGFALIASTLTLTVLTGSLTYFIYSDYGMRDSASTLDRLLGRSTGNGQLWYVTMQDRTVAFTVDVDQYDRLIDSLVSKASASSNLDNGVGIFYLVNRYAPDEIRDGIKAGQGYIQFTGGTEAYLILVFGHAMMLVIMAFLSILLGLSCYYTYNCIISHAYIGYLGSLYILVNIYGMLNQASLGQIFSVGSLKAIGVILAADATYRIAFGRRARATTIDEGEPAEATQQPTGP